MRLYWLDKLAWPEPMPDGAPRAAADGDVPLLSDWFGAFSREVGEQDDPQGRSADVRDKLGYGGVLGDQFHLPAHRLPARGRPHRPGVSTP